MGITVRNTWKTEDIMARIPVEKKGGASWIWWLLGLLVLIGLVWLLVEAFDDDEAELTEEPGVEAVTPDTTPGAATGTPAVAIGDILNNPAAYVGQTFPDQEVNVVEVPTDRGFWIEDQGQRLFAIIIDEPQEEPLDINPGQTLQIQGGTLRDSTYLPEMPGAPLDQETQNIVQEQPIFLVVDERNIDILEAGTPQPGTDPAESVQ